jgi:Lar family restriction alleviation protein
MSLELKPCPFCGNNNADTLQICNRIHYWIQCWKCFAGGPSSETKEHAIERWTKRSTS